MFPEKVSEKKIDLQLLENRSIDEPLKSLSSNKYIVIMDRCLILGEQMFQIVGSMPSACQWMTMPILHEKDLVTYAGGNMTLDRIFLAEGYARELADAYCILVSPTWDLGVCTPLDLLIKENKEGTLIPFSGRTLKGVTSKKVEGRYIFMTNMPEVTGEAIDLPYTYTLDTLASKFKVLQSRLQHYGTSRVESICACLSGIASAIRESPNQFKASQTYEALTSMVEKIKATL